MTEIFMFIHGKRILMNTIHIKLFLQKIPLWPKSISLIMFYGISIVEGYLISDPFYA